MPIYYYNGIVRTSLIFDTPNTCGAFLALFLIYMVCFLDFSVLDNKVAKDVLLWLVGMLVVLTEFLLVCTYSRAAYFATVISFVYLSIKRNAKIVRLSLLLFIAFICLFPSGVKRVVSSTDFQDGSIANRILLWKGAAAMIAQRPFNGMPFQEIGDYYRSVFLPLDIDARYSTMQNDWLTLGCVHGLWFSFILGAMIIWLALAGATLSFCSDICPKGKSILRYSTAMILAYVLVASFNTFYFRIPVVSLLGIAIAVLTFQLIKIARNNYHYLLLIVKLAPIATVLSLCLSLSVLFCGMSFLYSRPYQMSEKDWGDGLDIIPIMKRGKNSPVLLLLRQQKTPFEVEIGRKTHYLPVSYDDFRNLYRVSAENGFDFLLLGISSDVKRISSLAKKLASMTAHLILLCNEDIAYLLFSNKGYIELVESIGDKCEIVICCHGQMYDGGRSLKELVSGYPGRVLFIIPDDELAELGSLSQERLNFYTTSLQERDCQIDFFIAPKLLQLISQWHKQNENL